MVLLFFDLGTGEIFLIVLAVFLVFGPGKIPEFARSMGKFIGEIKRASEDVKEEINKEADRIEREKKREEYMKQKTDENRQQNVSNIINAIYICRYSRFNCLEIILYKDIPCMKFNILTL